MSIHYAIRTRSTPPPHLLSAGNRHKWPPGTRLRLHTGGGGTPTQLSSAGGLKWRETARNEAIRGRGGESEPAGFVGRDWSSLGLHSIGSCVCPPKTLQFVR